MEERLKKEDLDQGGTGRLEVIEGRSVHLIHALLRRLPCFSLAYLPALDQIHTLRARGGKKKRAEKSGSRIDRYLMTSGSR